MNKYLKSIWDLIIGEVPEIPEPIKEPIKEPIQEKKEQPKELYGFKVGDTVVFVREKRSYPPKKPEHKELVSGDQFVVKNIFNYNYNYNSSYLELSGAGNVVKWYLGDNNDTFCHLEDIGKFQKIIDAENNFKVEFKVRKREGVEDYSVWWRSANHPEHREWQCIVHPRSDGDNQDVVSEWSGAIYTDTGYCRGYKTIYYHPYKFDNKKDAELGIRILKTRDPKTLWAFERLWRDIKN